MLSLYAVLFLYLLLSFLGETLSQTTFSQITGQQLVIINPLFSLFINTVSYVHC